MSSRTIKRSIPCATISPLSGLASFSASQTLAGRRFAKRPSCARNVRRARRSGRFSGGNASHLGPPTAPRRTASASLHAASVASGRQSPHWSYAAPPTGCSAISKRCPNRRATALSVLTASVTIPGPMPSPGRIAIFAFICFPSFYILHFRFSSGRRRDLPPRSDPS